MSTETEIMATSIASSAQAAPDVNVSSKPELTAEEEYLQIGKTAHMLLLGEFNDEFPDAQEMLESAKATEERIGVLAQFANFWIGKTPEISDDMAVPPTIQVSKQICMQFVQQTLNTATTYGITPAQLTAYMAAHSEAVVEEPDVEEESEDNNADAGRTKCARKSARRRANKKAALAQIIGNPDTDMPPVVDDIKVNNE